MCFVVLWRDLRVFCCFVESSYGVLLFCGEFIVCFVVLWRDLRVFCCFVESS